jgi:threonine dehydrogenase-like Zn-dependent dehydrogenase
MALGTEAAGTVAAVGSRVAEVREGDEVMTHEQLRGIPEHWLRRVPGVADRWCQAWARRQSRVRAIVRRSWSAIGGTCTSTSHAGS